MNPKLNKLFIVLSQLSNGKSVTINGDVYYMSDSVLYREFEGRGLYVNMSLNKFMNMCNILTETELSKITKDYENYKRLYKREMN